MRFRSAEDAVGFPNNRQSVHCPESLELLVNAFQPKIDTLTSSADKLRYFNFVGPFFRGKFAGYASLCTILTSHGFKVSACNFKPNEISQNENRHCAGQVLVCTW